MGKNYWINKYKIKRERIENIAYYENYLQSLKKCGDKWTGDPLLFCHNGSDHFNEISAIIENTNLMAQEQYWKHNHRITELTSQILNNFIVFDLVSVQPMFSPCSNIYYQRLDYSKSPPELYIQYQASVAKSNLLMTVSDTDFENIPSLANKIREKITRQITVDLRNNAYHVANRQYDGSKDQILTDIIQMHYLIEKQTNRNNKTWIVVGKEIAIKLKDYCNYFVDLDTVSCTTKIGTISNYLDVFLDPLNPTDSILCGTQYGQSNMIDGYFYNPYILLSYTPVSLDPDTLEPRYGLMFRGSKRLVYNRYYGRINYYL